ncbi:MAG: hypothetical protein E3K36_12715 [Candidatus Brocadia sp.]|nr:hypothetical protein [Candidatus Brocadia sp.]
MARPLRLEFEGAFYHITSRGNLRVRIFLDDKDREKFLDILRRTKERYGYHLHAYALPENHYHLFLETPKANISQIMQNINTSYTIYINKRHKRSEDYRWTSYREYIGAYKEKESIVDTAETLSYFSKSKTAAMKAYGDFVKEGTGERNNPLEDVEAGVLLGNKIFIAKIRGMSQRRKPDEEIPQVKR